MSNDNYVPKHRASTFSNGTYDVLKWIALIGLPAFGTLYFGLAEIWGLPYATEVVGTIVVLETFLGVILGISKRNYDNSGQKYDGNLVVDTSSPDRDLYSLEVETPLEDVADKGELTLKVKPAR